MCFRPSQADMSVMCPNCGKKVSSLGGVIQTQCPFCGSSLEGAREATAADNLPTAPLGNPSAPKAPSAPGTPNTPKPPAQ